MKKNFVLFLLTVFFLTGSLLGADRLAVAEPVAKGGIKPAEIEAIWGILESSIHSKEYTVISRSALKQMITEIGLTDKSGLTNLNSAQRAKMGRLETVKYILISEVGRLGTGIQCTLRIMDASTGEIDSLRTASLRVRNMDELADRIESVMEKLLSDQKQPVRSALLMPAAAGGVPAYAVMDLHTLMEESLLNGGVPLQNLRFIEKILKENKIGRPDELEPKMYTRLGQLLEVQNLILASVTRFGVSCIPYNVEETGARGIRRIGNFEGAVRVISVRNGQVIGTVPFRMQVNFRRLDPGMTRDWAPEDYGKYMIRTVVTSQIAPKLLPILSKKR